MKNAPTDPIKDPSRHPLESEDRLVDSSIPQPKLAASDRRKLNNLQKRRKWEAHLSGHLLTKQYRQVVGPAIYLLAIILRDCDWNTGRWRGTLRIVALELDVSERSLSAWLHRLKKIEGFTVHKLIEGTEAQLPHWLIPNPKGTGRKLPVQTRPTRRFFPPEQKKSVSQPEEKRRPTGRNTAGPQQIGSIISGYTKSKLNPDRKKSSSAV